MGEKRKTRRLRRIDKPLYHDPVLVQAGMTLTKSAKQGTIIGVAVAAVNTDGTTHSYVVWKPEHGRPILLLGELCCLEARLRDKIRIINGANIGQVI